MEELHAAARVSGVHEPTLVEVELPRGSLGGPGIVSHHDDGLALLAVHHLQQVEDLLRRVPVEIAGGLVAYQERGIGDQGPRDRHALLLPARELRRLVRTPVTQAHQVQRRADIGAALRLRQIGEQQRQLHILLGGQQGHQVVELEHEADVARAPARELPRRVQADAFARHDDVALIRLDRSRPPG